MDSSGEEEEEAFQAELVCKRNFLLEEIIESGYDQETFSEFFREKIGHQDLEMASFGEVQDIVKQFKSRFKIEDTAEVQDCLGSVPSPTIDDEVIEESKEETKEETKEESKEETKEETKEEPGNPLESAGIYIVHCVPAVNNELCQIGDIDVMIPHSERVQARWLYKAYTIYTIQTQVLDWVVQRRYSDFLWLRDNLALNYPGVLIPPIIPKRAIKSCDEQSVLRKTKLMAKFLYMVCRNPLLKRSRVLTVFLKETDQKALGRLKKELSGSGKPEIVQEFTTLNGKIECSLQDNQRCVQQIVEHATASEALKKSLNKQTSKICNDLEVLSATLTEYANVIKDLEGLQLPVPGSQEIKQLYENLYTALLHWSNYELQKAATISEYFSAFFKYGCMEAKEYKKFSRDYEDHRRAFLRSQGEASERVKNQYGYYNVQFFKETSRVSVDNLLMGCKYFIEFSALEIEHSTKMHNVWNKLLLGLTSKHSTFSLTHY